MTVSSSLSAQTFTCDGGTTVFTCPFRVLESAEMVGYLITVATNESVQLVNGSDFAVTGVGSANAVAITTLAYSSAYQVNFRRRTQRLQSTDYRDNDPFPAESHEAALDRLTHIAQENDTDIGRALLVPEPETGVTLPAANVRAGRLLGFGSTGEPVAVAPVDGTASALALDLASSAAASKGAGQVGYSDDLAYAAGTVGNKLRELRSLADFPSLATAIASGVRRIYVPAGTTSLGAVVSATLTADLELFGEGAFLWSGGVQTSPMITIQCAGYSLRLRGLSFDGANLAPGGLRIENTAAMSDDDPVCVLDECKLANFRMTTASIWNLAAYIAGSFSLVEVRNNRVRNITRAAGTGTPGTTGTTGIYVTQYDAARWVRQCTHTGNSYTNISASDLVGSANNVDLDGFKFYAPNPTNNDNVDATVSSYFPATCQSFGNSYRNVGGRAVKIQAIGNVYGEKVIRDAGYTITNGSTEINLQYGAGTVRDCEFFYKDYAGPTSPIQTAGLTLVSFYQGEWYDEANGGCSASGLRVYNNIKAGIGNNINQLVNAQVGATVLGKDRSLIRVSDITVNRGDVDWMLTLSGDTGADALVVLEDVSVPKLTYSAIGTGFANPSVKLIARGIYNLDGVTTPGNAKKFISDTAVPGGDIAWSGSVDGHGIHGFLNTFNRGADFTQAPLLVGGGLTGTGIGGAASVQTVSLADDASHTFERRFFNSSRGLVLVSVNFDYTSQGVFACGSNAVYQIAAHASDVFQPSTSGSNTDTDGQLNLWFTGGALNVKNRLGGTYSVTVMFLG